MLRPHRSPCLIGMGAVVGVAQRARRVRRFNAARRDPSNRMVRLNTSS
jgi:hypothetical protein